MNFSAAMKSLEEAAVQIERERCLNCVPTTWLDSLLSGPNKVAEFSDGPAVERLLKAIRDRIASGHGEQPGAPAEKSDG